MAYTWDKNLLKEIKENDEDEYALLTEDLSFEEENYNLKKNIFKDIKNILNVLYFYNALYKNNKYDLYPVNGYFTNKFKYDDLLYLTNEFYKTIDPELYNIFEKQFNKRYRNFRFSKDLSENQGYSGMSYYVKDLDETLIEVEKKKEYDNLLTIIHEYGHAISFNYLKDDPDTYARDVYCEIESTFMELIAMDYFAKLNEFKNDNSEQRNRFFNSFILDNDRILTTYNMTVIFKLYLEFFDNINYKEYKSIVRKLMNLKNKDFNNLFSSDILSSLKYSLSTFVSLELYHIYQTDPDKAFYLYKKILSLKDKTPITFDNSLNEMNIFIGKNVKTYVRKLTK